MRYPPSEKLEIIRLVERSHLPVRRTLDKLGIPTTCGPTGPSRARGRRVSLLRARRVARGALPWTAGTSSQPPVAPLYTAAVCPSLLRR